MTFNNASTYKILGQGQVNSNDKTDFSNVLAAMKISGFTETEQTELLKIIAAILCLGNVEFDQLTVGVEGEHAEIKEDDPSIQAVQQCAKLLNIEFNTLAKALTKKTISAGFRDTMETNLTLQQAIYAREAMVKSLYSKTFDWLVQRINKGLQAGLLRRQPSLKHKSSRNVIGLLDIYGFEIFEKNLFEQLCINFCNEKLQQLFVNLTLKQEQEEYQTEQIQWEPVDFFNNKPICSLIEHPKSGLIAILDEECRLPGNTSDMTFLEKTENVLNKNPFYKTFNLMGPVERKDSKIERNQFIIKHYAGDVTYNVDQFLDKNNDAFYRDLKATISSSDNSIAAEFFSESDIQEKRLPPTAATQFKKSLRALSHSNLIV